MAVSNVISFSFKAAGAAGLARDITQIDRALGRLFTTVTAVSTAVTKMGSDFEQGMANVQSVARGSAREIRDLEMAARNMAVTTTHSAANATKAMYALASAGLSVKQILQAVGPVATLAGGTMTDLSQTAEMIVAAVKQFGYEFNQAGRVADVFAAAIQTSLLNMERLGESIKYVGPIARSVGMDIEQTVAALAALHDAGLMGSIAGTGLRQMLLRLAKPTDEITTAFGGLELTVDGLLPMLEKLSDGTITTAQLFKLFNVRAVNAMLVLRRLGREGLEDYISRVDRAGAASEMFGIQLDTLQASFSLTINRIKDIGLTLYEQFAPYLRVILVHVRDLTEKLSGVFNRKFRTDLDLTLESLRKVGYSEEELANLVAKFGKEQAVAKFAEDWKLAAKNIDTASGKIGEFVAAQARGSGGFAGFTLKGDTIIQPIQALKSLVDQIGTSGEASTQVFRSVISELERINDLAITDAEVIRRMAEENLSLDDLMSSEGEHLVQLLTEMTGRSEDVVRADLPRYVTEVRDRIIELRNALQIPEVQNTLLSTFNELQKVSPELFEAGGKFATITRERFLALINVLVDYDAYMKQVTDKNSKDAEAVAEQQAVAYEKLTDEIRAAILAQTVWVDKIGQDNIDAALAATNSWQDFETVVDGMRTRIGEKPIDWTGFLNTTQLTDDLVNALHLPTGEELLDPTMVRQARKEIKALAENLTEYEAVLDAMTSKPNIVEVITGDVSVDEFKDAVDTIRETLSELGDPIAQGSDDREVIERFKTLLTALSNESSLFARWMEANGIDLSKVFGVDTFDIVKQKYSTNTKAIIAEFMNILDAEDVVADKTVEWAVQNASTVQGFAANLRSAGVSEELVALATTWLEQAQAITDANSLISTSTGEMTEETKARLAQLQLDLQAAVEAQKDESQTFQEWMLDYMDRISWTLRGIWDEIFEQMWTGEANFEAITKSIAKFVWDMVFDIGRAILQGRILQRAGEAATDATSIAGSAGVESASLSAASAQIFAAHAWMPFIGVPTAEALIGEMLAAHAANKAAAAAFGAITLGQGVFGFAEGGPVYGRAGRDRVPAMLTAGEYVMPAGAAEQYGPLLEAMRDGTLRVGSPGANLTPVFSGPVFAQDRTALRNFARQLKEIMGDL